MAQVFDYYFQRRHQQLELKPGIMTVIHTFGRDLKLFMCFENIRRQCVYRIRKKEEWPEDSLAWLEAEDPSGIKAPIELVSFVCTKCQQIDEVPAYIIGEFMVDKRLGEAVSLACPYCNGEMFEAKNDTSESSHLGRA